MRFAIQDALTPQLLQVIARCSRPRSILAAGAKSMQAGLSQHLRTLQGRGNQKGWPSQKFFAGRPTSVERQVGLAELTDFIAVVVIADPRFVHRITGGTVTAKRAAALAIPLTAEAARLAGRGSLRESAPGLIPVRNSRGSFLAARVGRGKGAKLVFLFVLKRSVTHSAHPEESPDLAALSARARVDMATAGQRLLRGQT
jgi:hypothetical protein